MSSTIKLYEHNQKAYDALLDMLGERDRACIIKPTGTGKFVIIAKMVQDNPDKRFLLLGTNDYMFNDQMANLAEIAPGFTPENLQFMTYSAAMMTARRGEEISGYDVVVADEFHHCGAEEWGKGVTHILDANESAKVVGFSATPIRYSDGGRNMADEMFDGNVAYSMELEEAWLRGILPIPKYVTAFYEAPKELGSLATTHPELAAEWDYDRNGELRPSDVLPGSTRAVWWKCSKCHGVWQCKVVNRKLNAVRCPYCRKKRLLKGFNDLASQYPELAKEYLPELNSGITADELLIRNETNVKWRCCKCGYEWITTIGHRAKRGTGCPRCNGKKTSQRKMKAVVCVETGKTYESIMSAGRDVERTDGAICRALRNESQTCAGYHWRYLDE